MNPLTWDAPVAVIYVALFVIVMFRANITYWVGRVDVGGARHTGLVSRLDSPRFTRATALLNKYGPPLVSACFLTVGLQTTVLLSAGVSRMPLPRFLPAVIIGCALWALLYGTVGFVGVEALIALYQLLS